MTVNTGSEQLANSLQQRQHLRRIPTMHTLPLPRPQPLLQSLSLALSLFIQSPPSSHPSLILTSTTSPARLELRPSPAVCRSHF